MVARTRACCSARAIARRSSRRGIAVAAFDCRRIVTVQAARSSERASTSTSRTTRSTVETTPASQYARTACQIGAITADTETDSPTSTSGGGASSESSTVRVRGATLEVTRPGDGTTVHGAFVPHSDASSRQRERSGNESHTAQRSLAFVPITSAAVGQPGSLGWTAIGEEGSDEAVTTPFMMSSGVSWYAVLCGGSAGAAAARSARVARMCAAA